MLKKFCKNHPDKAYTTKLCPACNAARHAAWRKNNPEKAKAYQAAYYKANIEKAKALASAYYKTNSEKVKSRSIAYRKDNMAKAKATDAEYYKANLEKIKLGHEAWRKNNPERVKAGNAAWRKANPEKRRALNATWDKANPEKASARCAKYRATKLNATPAWADDFIIKEAYHLAKLRSKIFGFKWHVDHIVPLQSKLVCGLHCEANLRVIPGAANHCKGNRYWPDMPEN